MPTRFLDRLGQGGFRYLLDHGTHYASAHYNHANTETAVGHSTLFTGANPSGHGIVANDWIDITTGDFVYNTEDDRHHLIGEDPQPHEGMSPRNLLASTIGDELVLHNAGRSRVFSVSIKDRGAILPGGHAGKAFWYSKQSGNFVTSTYYVTVRRDTPLDRSHAGLSRCDDRDPYQEITTWLQHIAARLKIAYAFWPSGRPAGPAQRSSHRVPA